MTDEVIVAVEGRAGRLRLNRPKAIHALNRPMCVSMLDALDAFAADEQVEVVMIDHAEGRGFCAGGDIRAAAESGRTGGAEAKAFFFTEYRLNHRLFTYKKPVVAFMDGITMGGGVGLSLPARLRVATENTRLAMPETGIGLFPDVGGGWYLSRLPGRMGQFLALTGHRLNGAECRALGLATHFLPAARLDEAKRRIAEAPEDRAAILADLSEPAGEAPILAHADAIDRLFASDDLDEVLAALDADGGDFARAQRASLATKSPQTMKVALRLLKEGAGMTDFADEMAQEYAVACRIVVKHDFIEGVRAVIVDKDNAPRWSPAPDAAEIDAIFAPLPVEDAWTPHEGARP